MEDGIIQGQEVVIDWAALGYSVQVALRITLDKTVPRAFDEFIAAARAVHEVLEIQTFLGRVDVRLLLIAKDLPDYQRIYRAEVLTLPHIADIEALMTVAHVKRTRRRDHRRAQVETGCRQAWVRGDRVFGGEIGDERPGQP